MSDTMQQIAVPTTIDELRTAIESIFHVKGKWNCQSILVGDGQRITFTTYAVGCKRQDTSAAMFPPPESFYPTAEAAIAGMWETVLRIRAGTMMDFLGMEEQIQDGILPPPITCIYWRIYPELITHPNGIYTVRMRAAFT